MAHINEVLPRAISAGSSAIPSTVVDILRNPAGYDVRIQRRRETLRRFDLAFSLRRMEDPVEQERGLYEILSHFEICEGPKHTFPLLDRLDWKSCGPLDEPTAFDVLLGEGDGGTEQFQLRKGYTRGAVTKYRTILLPIASSVLIAVDGALKTTPANYSLDPLTGIVTFAEGSIPGTGAQVTAGFKFYCKVRFDTNDLTQTYEGFHAGQAGSVPVIEVRR